MENRSPGRLHLVGGICRPNIKTVLAFILVINFLGILVFFQGSLQAPPGSSDEAQRQYKWTLQNPFRRPSLQRPSMKDIEVVVASTKADNTSWLQQFLPDWPKSIYIVDDAAAGLSVPQNKGREAMSYLTYLIDQYENLPAKMLFIHAARFQWHNDDPDYDNLPLLKSFQWPYLEEQGYVNLRCTQTLGCPLEIRPFDDYQNKPNHETADAYKKAFQELFPDRTVPVEIGVACCAQFGVTRHAVRRRPKEDYIGMRKWLISTGLKDETSGRVFEYSWHMIFGKNAVHCPEAQECICRTFGQCSLKCNKMSCENHWTVPPYSTLPEGWPNIGWDGEQRNFSGPL